jgi:hypothetical protein
VRRGEFVGEPGDFLLDTTLVGRLRQRRELAVGNHLRGDGRIQRGRFGGREAAQVFVAQVSHGVPVSAAWGRK